MAIPLQKFDAVSGCGQLFFAQPYRVGPDWTGDPFLCHVGAYKNMAPRSHFSVEDTEQYQYVLTNFVSQSIRSNEHNPYTFKFHMCSV